MATNLNNLYKFHPIDSNWIRYNILKSTEYIDYTKKVIVTLGDELEKYFNIDFNESSGNVLKARFKSKNSLSKNIEKAIKKNQANSLQYLSYDINGMKIILKNLPISFFMPQEFINEYLKDQNIHLINGNIPDYIYNTIAGEYVTEEVLKKSKKLQDLGVFINTSDRTKKRIAKPNGYRASHYCLASSLNQYPFWIGELQTRSFEIEKIATDGSAAHWKLEGKKRILPDLPSNHIEFKSFFNEIKNTLPEYLIYNGNSKLQELPLSDVFYYYYRYNLSITSNEYKEQLDNLFASYNYKNTDFWELTKKQFN